MQKKKKKKGGWGGKDEYAACFLWVATPARSLWYTAIPRRPSVVGDRLSFFSCSLMIPPLSISNVRNSVFVERDIHPLRALGDMNVSSSIE
ncbi:hypothetical protein ACKS23_08281 [Histoplasma ohiense]